MTVWKIANIDRQSIIAELSSVSEFSSIEMANQFCEFFSTMLSMQTLPYLQKFRKRNCFPWFELIRYERFKTKSKKRQAERQWRNNKLIAFKDLHRQASSRF